jgi:signal transduction histidine kinase
MRLASKIFVTCASVVAVLVGVGAYSIESMRLLIGVNRDIATRNVPALRRTIDAQERLLDLTRLEARSLVLEEADPRFARVWTEQAAQVRVDLEELRDLVSTRGEAVRLDEAVAAFDQYRDAITRAHRLISGGQRTRGQRVALEEGRPQAVHIERLLAGLAKAIETAVADAQAEAARLETRTWTTILVAVATALVLSLGGTVLVALRLTRSLRGLSAATTALAAGAFRVPLPVEGRDEVADLARSFNAMALRLRQLDELKESFLATVSHELRSPLTSMREAAHLLRDNVPGELNPKQARLVAIIGQSADRLLRLVNQILDLSRLRAGMLPIERLPVDLDRVVGRALDELRPQAEDSGIVIERDRVGAAGAFTVMGDEDRLVQVVVNLVANALRFTPRTGRITTRLLDAGEEVELQVEDTGVGIPAATLPHIFDWYRQADQSKGGTGLGLGIVRGIVEAHGGRVTVESSEGKGSRFTVLLPRRKVS